MLSRCPYRSVRPIRVLLGVGVVMAPMAPMVLIGSCAQSAAVDHGAAGRAPQHRTPIGSTAAISLESISDGTTHDLPGVHHVLVQAPGVLSGGVPEGDEGFATLAALGIKAVLSVDAAPVDLDAAKAHGLRYVQIPVEYAGVSGQAARQLAVALRDLDGPIYIHCHHGQHRGPAAAALALVQTGRLTNSEALDRLHAAGTSPNYPGLFRCVRQATAYSPQALAALQASLPERARVGSLAGAMAVIDRAFERLDTVRANGWVVPEDHPDLSPVALAATIEANLRALSHMPSGGMSPPIEDLSQRESFSDSMRESARHASSLESTIAGTDWASASRAWIELKNSCSECHRVYRNEYRHSP